jgi:hypothetical protein
MSAGTRDFDRGSQFRAARKEPPLPNCSDTVKKPVVERLRLVRADEPSFLTTKSLKNAGKSSVDSRRPSSDYRMEECAAEPIEAEEELVLETLPPREPGVDLGMLRPKEIDVGKLASFKHEVPATKKAGKATTTPASSGKAIVMPLAKTDLKDIFQADQVCMVARPPEKAPPKAPEPEPETPPPAVASIPPKNTPSADTIPLPSKKRPHFLDETQQYLVENWPKLPPHVQAAILNVIDAAVSPDDD